MAGFGRGLGFVALSPVAGWRWGRGVERRGAGGGSGGDAGWLHGRRGRVENALLQEKQRRKGRAVGGEVCPYIFLWERPLDISILSARSVNGEPAFK